MGEIADKFKAKRRARELATCRHFTGIQNGVCKAGVRYLDVRDTSGSGPFRWPCLGEECATKCPKREQRTEVEVDAEEAQIARRFAAILPARAAIIATKQSDGAVDCPLCKTAGALHFRVSSYNGHVHAACSTTNCLSWME